MLCYFHRLYTECGYLATTDALQPAAEGGPQLAPDLSRLRAPAARWGELAGHRESSPPVIRIGVGAWRVAPRPQPAASRRTIAATASSGTPTGQAADAASSSGESPDKSDAASPNRA